MWEKISKEQAKAARELVDPTLPHLLINEATAGHVSYEQLTKGLTLSTAKDDPRIEGAKVRVFIAGQSGGFSEVIEAVQTQKIQTVVPKEKSETFAGDSSQVWYYVIESASGDEKWTASEREHYSMGAKP